MTILPSLTLLALHGTHAGVMTAEGEIISIDLTQRIQIPSALKNGNTILTCHAPWVSSRIDLPTTPAWDVLELFAFCKPATFCTPTIQGLTHVLELPKPENHEDATLVLMDIVNNLLGELNKTTGKEREQIISLAKTMARQGAGWVWSIPILDAMGETYDPGIPINPKQDMNIFEHLPEMGEEAPPPPSSFHTLSGDEARIHLENILIRRQANDEKTEKRPQQMAYTTRVADTLRPRSNGEDPHVLLAQAGTGTGKTFGYLSPAQLWAEKNNGHITISTYTKNLQRQIEQDIHALYPNPEDRTRKSVIQKGRENYLCLLNLENEIIRAAMATDSHSLIAAGLMARWAMVTPDGDFTGNSFPGWLRGLLGMESTTALADRRGECVYAACDHYHKCFIERINRKAARAELIINNHALTMIRTAMNANDENALSPFVIFDEAHHLFQAADSAFGANLTGMETADLRRWLIGPEDAITGRQLSRPSRGRGLRKRLEGLVTEDSPAMRDIGKIITAAKQSLPAPGWRKRIMNNDPHGPIESLLTMIYQQVLDRAGQQNIAYSIECDVTPTSDTVIEKITPAIQSLQSIRAPLQDLAENLQAMLEDKKDELDHDTKKRISSLASGIEYRSAMLLASWMGMLESLFDQQNKEKTDHIDWFESARIDGRFYDTGMIRRFTDPMSIFTTALKPNIQGAVMTSATLRSDSNDPLWLKEKAELGINTLTDHDPQFEDLASPFDYAASSRIIIVTDCNKNDPMALAVAYRELFLASNGGALGLFTAISRLRQVHRAIADNLHGKNIPLYAQHIDDIDIGTLTDMFREDMNSCLLGTDAIRDGIDVPGQSLRLMVFDRVPWPRPTILHRERKKIFGGRDYDDHLTRMKLKQAYGRLIRSQNDRGVFVILDGAMPSRLHTAFPPDATIERMTLKEAVQAITHF